jgi:ectoine hydroxylase-related dioxygenase (phytanoyl-CoA dioxygenase family)
MVPGSHKANLESPESLRTLDKYQDFVKELHGKAGDALIFCESCIHGKLFCFAHELFT